MTSDEFACAISTNGAAVCTRIVCAFRVTVISTYVTGSVKRDLNSLFKTCVYFQEVYFCNALRNLNQMRLFYGGGVAAGMKWK